MTRHTKFKATTLISRFSVNCWELLRTCLRQFFSESCKGWGPVIVCVEYEYASRIVSNICLRIYFVWRYTVSDLMRMRAVDHHHGDTACCWTFKQNSKLVWFRRACWNVISRESVITMTNLNWNWLAAFSIPGERHLNNGCSSAPGVAVRSEQIHTRLIIRFIFSDAQLRQAWVVPWHPMCPTGFEGLTNDMTRTGTCATLWFKKSERAFKSNQSRCVSM